MVLWGFEEFFLKQAIDNIKTFSTLLINTIAGIIIGVLFTITFIGTPSLIGGQDLLLVVLCSTTALLGYIFFYTALERQEVSLIAALDESWIIVTIIIAVVFFGERLTLLHMAGILGVLIGAFLISAKFEQLKRITFISGSGYEVMSILFIGVTLALDKIIIDRIGEANAIIYLLVGVLPLIFIAKTVMREEFVRPTRKMTIIVALSGIFDSLAFGFAILAISRADVSLVAPIIASTAIVSVLLAHLFLKEHMTLQQAIGATVLLASVITLSTIIA